ncbi:hypothetical protein HanIR_Chr08g0381081 [Helianthus annuus]|nr:hypothetical protein HanIR_Chr08g0381081 [Helianthus annuus]
MAFIQSVCHWNPGWLGNLSEWRFSRRFKKMPHCSIVFINILAFVVSWRFTIVRLSFSHSKKNTSEEIKLKILIGSLFTNFTVISLSVL